MKLCYHGARNTHGMSTHPRRVRTDPNLPTCTMSVCVLNVPLPCSYCRLYIPIRTRTGQLGSGLRTQSSTPTEPLGLASDYQLPSIQLRIRKSPCNVRIGQINTFWESELLILSNMEVTSQLFICANEIKPRTLASPGVYNHCNGPSDSEL